MNSKNRIIYLLALLKFSLPFILQNRVFELHRDEYLYYEQGHHLAFGYLENPPMIGLLASLSSFFGGSFFWIKFWPALFGAFTLLLTCAIVKEFGGRFYAQLIASLGILFSAYLRIHFLFQPNFLDIFFWTLSIYYLLRFLNTQHNKYLYLLSIALALGWWSKYSILFFILSIVTALLLSHHRNIFAKKSFWLAVLTGLLLILPNILWQYYHRWPLVHHMSELKATQLQFLNKTDFFKEQLLMLLPVCFVWLGGLLWLLKQKKYRVISYIYFIAIFLIITGSGKGYYALGAYPMLLAAGGVWLEKISAGKIWIRISLNLFIVIAALPFIPLLLPTQTPTTMDLFNKKYAIEKMGLLKWEDQKNHLLQQDFADMLGWKELSNKTEKFFTSLPDSAKTNCVIYCRNYGQAGALKYYGRSASFKEKVISDNGTFLLWIPPKLSFHHLIFIGRNMPDKNDLVFQQFEKITVVDSVTNRFSRQYGDKIIFFQNASDSAKILAQKGLAKMKAVFGE